ncbi:uncharacterized protein LOC130712530 [Lotus japonicus]|uniref:uncharacterized protein LOC130712530 n=1 Tax=Lotus japonicus TaxID=34305 RepID=UPI0025866058|nr:uncharacterized protein LOC130712530 [Lotus japonicus]
MMSEPKISTNKSSQQENRIMVDALSLNYDSALPNVRTTWATTDFHLPSLQAPKPKFMSLSLPNSANSSPVTSTLKKKKSKGGSTESPCQASNLIFKDRHVIQEIHLRRRSKSYGEARASAPFDEFDLCLAKPNAMEHNKHDYSFPKIEAIEEGPMSGKNPETPAEEEKFKCCMYLPGFGKAKPVKSTRKEGSEMEDAISSRVSLEKFECGSWASSTLLHEIEGDTTNSYYDLPMELIKCSVSDVHAPVTSAFVFEKELKGVLKNGSSRGSARKSDAAPHHVRFSISSTTPHPASPASCNAAHLRKASEDFKAFLEAQST